MAKDSGKLEKRLAAYGSMSLALAAVSMPATARASEITWSADITTGNGPAGAVYFDLLTGYAGSTATSVADFELLTSVQGTSNPVYQARILISPDDATVNGNMFAASASLVFGGGASSVGKLSPGAKVGPNLIFSNVAGTLAENESPYFGHWNGLPASGYLGLEFKNGGTRYGWAAITVNSDYTITLNGFGFENSGSPAYTDTPEPASILLLALGAAGLETWRRKRSRTPLP
jgi:hypothetical protein